MKKNNTVTLEELDKSKIKPKKEFNYFKFFKAKILPKILVCIVVAVIIVLIFTISSVNQVKSLGCTEMYCSSEEITISENFISRAEMLILTLVASVVPYFYMPYLGLVLYMYNEVVTLAHVINLSGYLFGILKYILPLTFNICSITIVTGMAVYIVNIVTNKTRMNRNSSMNFTNFRLKIYGMLKRQDKYDALYNKQQDRIEKLQKNTEKIQWKGVAITAGIAFVIQFVGVVLQNILI